MSEDGNVLDSMVEGAGEIAGRVGEIAGNVWAGMNFVIDGKESNPGSGGGFEFDADTARGLYERANAIVHELQDQAWNARRLVETKAPADDPASQSFTKAGNEIFRRGAEHVDAEVKFYRDFARALGKAIGMYEESDEQAGKDVTKSGGEGDSGGGYW
ncbi:hypothetical protein GCM10009676_28410 [Prauserella halophila]|uniref:PE domain-containing protein n=1 Tax=Prauserella halophila TaxID=185641 RepID=A0ABP4H1P9_9PSEU|nr:hypothetical protein [Prauserella halophila]MCP2236902.1 hypothetical protein [Prauserella halophila]